MIYDIYDICTCISGYIIMCSYRQISYMTSYSYTASACVKSAGNQSLLDEVVATLQPIAQTLKGQASTLIHTLDMQLCIPIYMHAISYQFI